MNKILQRAKQRVGVADENTSEFTSTSSLFKEVDKHPYRSWNTADFTGKYHLTKFSNKETPLPGTQVALEKAYENQRKQYDEFLVKRQEDHEKKLDKKLRVKKEAVTLQMTLYFNTLFHSKIDEAEKILYEKEHILHDRPGSPKDEMALVDRFRKNIEQGRSHYVSYAVSTGFQSIDYQDPETGNTFLHIACRKGYVDTVEELLKYKCNPDVKNRLGYYPVHEAWMFWNTDPEHRTKEERLDQEKRTCEILLKLFTYGAFVDAATLNHETPLHIACRLGPTKAVKIIMSFYGSLEAKTLDGHTPESIALEFQQIESYKLIQSWEYIRPQFINTDFRVIWWKFLKDSEAIISKHKSAETILSEIELEQNASHMERAGRDNKIFIDDPLLQHAYVVTRSDNTCIPKPWEAGWKKYVKNCKASGVVDLKTRLESLKGKLKGVPKKGKLQNAAEDRREMLPDRPIPKSWPEKIEEQQKKEQEEMKRLMEEEESLGEDSYSAHPYGSITTSKAEEREKMVQGSSLMQRRRQFAQKVALDAKFLRYTNRMTHDSALALPLRTPQAPMDHTEEEGSILRLICSQGPEFERMQKYRQKDRYEELMGFKKSPRKNVLGAYCEDMKFSNMTDRDKLFDCLANRSQLDVNLIQAKGSGGSALDDDKNKNKNSNGNKNLKAEPEKKAKIDMVRDYRPRYVNSELLPGKFEPTQVEIMIKEQKEKEMEAMLKKQHLGSENMKQQARLEMEAKLAEGGDSSSMLSMDAIEEHAIDPDGPAAMRRKRAAAAKQRALNKLFFSKPEVVYGEGRLKSTHNMKGKIEEPWNVINGRYQTLPGDRTA